MELGTVSACTTSIQVPTTTKGLHLSVDKTRRMELFTGVRNFSSKMILDRKRKLHLGRNTMASRPSMVASMPITTVPVHSTPLDFRIIDEA